MKNPSIQIHDKVRGAGYRVKSVGANNEILETSEVLNDVKAVKTHIRAMTVCWSTDPHNFRDVTDCTRGQKFFISGFAVAAKLDKMKFTKQK